MIMYDLIVIGGGPAGYVGAIRAAELGAKVALVERAELGGTCLNWGCIPTKALLKSAQVYHYCQTAKSFGVAVEGEVKADLKAMVARSRQVAATTGRGVEMLLKKAGVEVIVGSATLVSANEVQVGEATYEAKNILLATGASPREVPSIPIDHQFVLSSRDTLVLEELPETMVVVGSGAIGSEFAFFYASLGVKVTVVEYLPQFMPLLDAEVSAAAERSFRRLRATVMTNTAVKGVSVVDGKCVVDIEQKGEAKQLVADKVLSAVGIKSNIEGLGLDKVGVQVERDKIVVDKAFRTSVSSIFAVGDIIASPALAHIASAEAVNCVEQIMGQNPPAIDYTLTPACVFTSPEIASVGLTEEQAQKQGIEYKVARYNFASSGKAAAAGDRDGFIKLIFDAENKLRGAHIIGGNVVEMLGEPSVAMTLGATAEDLARTIHAHPSLYEGIMEAAKEVE
ncbi:MAG: dihydrolipoyl dehydrogenase [Rikenellaceae bacterium]|nr:dihydrolipoyl dehydrogenase [Rikenellaceae bacterium]